MDFAIVGCGFIAKKHAKAIENVADAKLVAVSDKIPEAMTPYVEEYGVTPYTELDEMLQEKDIDVVCICTPSGLHAPLAVRIAAAKNILYLKNQLL